MNIDAAVFCTVVAAAELRASKGPRSLMCNFTSVSEMMPRARGLSSQVFGGCRRSRRRFTKGERAYVGGNH